MKPLILAAAIACNLEELGNVSRVWEKLIIAPVVVFQSGGAGTVTGFYYARCTGQAQCDTCGSVQVLRERAGAATKKADRLEHRDKTEKRWRELVRACFPEKKK